MAQFLIQVPRDVLMLAISKTKARPFTELEARVSLYLDVDRGEVHGLSRYARQWGWAKQTVHNRWNAITRDVWAWASWNNGASDNPVARKFIEVIPGTSTNAFDPKMDGTVMGRTWDGDGTKNNVSESESNADGTVMGRTWDGDGTHTYQPLVNQITSSNEEVCDREAEDGKKKPKKEFVSRTPPSVEEIAAYFVERGVAPSAAEAFRDFYVSKGWKVGKNPMRDWKASVRNWIRSMPTYSKNGAVVLAPARASPTKPDPPPRSFSGDYMEVEMENFGLQADHFMRHDTNQGERWTLTRQGEAAKRRRISEISAEMAEQRKRENGQSP